MIKQGFEASIKEKKIDIFNLISINKQINLNKRVIKFTKLSILILLSIRLFISKFYTKLTCKLL